MAGHAGHTAGVNVALNEHTSQTLHMCIGVNEVIGHVVLALSVFAVLEKEMAVSFGRVTPTLLNPFWDHPANSCAVCLPDCLCILSPYYPIACPFCNCLLHTIWGTWLAACCLF